MVGRWGARTQHQHRFQYRAAVWSQNIDYLEVNRGSTARNSAIRTYGVFNVVPRTGFERNNQAELVLSAGNFYQTNDSLSFGSHTQMFAYYASINGNRSNLGLEPPIPVVHDAAKACGFGSFIFNVNPSNQLRLVTALRKDFYQVPYDPNFQDLESAQFDSSGTRDLIARLTLWSTPPG